MAGVQVRVYFLGSLNILADITQVTHKLFKQLLCYMFPFTANKTWKKKKNS